MPEHTGHPSSWFEPLYADAARGATQVPWERDHPQPLHVEWAGRHGIDGQGRPAMVVGSGYGQDAEFVATLGFRTTAFDISRSAIAEGRRRFPDSPVEYHVANLFCPSKAWRQAFDLVVEHITVQSVPIPFHARTSAIIAELVAPGGR